jgi:histidine triad (HIT) family protein
MAASYDGCNCELHTCDDGRAQRGTVTYDLPDQLLGRVAALRRRLALAFKRLGTEGTSSRQHNEPAGYQDVWHYHEHVFPRYAGDRLYAQDRISVDAVRRAAQAARVREALADVFADLPLES